MTECHACSYWRNLEVCLECGMLYCSNCRNDTNHEYFCKECRNKLDVEGYKICFICGEYETCHIITYVDEHDNVVISYKPICYDCAEKGEYRKCLTK